MTLPAALYELAQRRRVITKRVGGTFAMQLVSTAFSTSKKDLTMPWVQALAADEGLENATCATFGIVTTVAFGSVRPTRRPNDGAVWPSYPHAARSV
jgi:hypothetical protein